MSVELSLEAVDSALSDRARAYLAALAAALDEEAVVAVHLFGSVVSDETTPISDVDLIVVLASDVSESYVADVERRCEELAAAHLDAGTDDRSALERAVERATGMYRSGFVTTEAAVAAGEFPAVFDTSPIAPFVAPWRTVLFGVFETGVTVYGRPVEPRWEAVGTPFAFPYRELLRSLLTTVALAAAQVGYALVSPRAIDYSLEAAKWTAYNCAFHLGDGPSGSLDRAVDLAPVPRWYRRRFLALRSDPEPDLGFVVLTPLVVLYAHLVTIARLVRAPSQQGRE
ncbi:nucleotidyltransferase domain-containing protein [Halobellus limi]|jgi:predicted nucleotidyltransferase|uniref:Nucleotidyltransferase domain-containing protein n=1 Tax=Halobellus limi TaxID=699433 RepID=A0A1H5ZLZ8_9EURY|nr:nucleotidyltransferase domain-containing protein [Halobellus limi]QCC48026.1 nucleotidyltransferase domain-containing protein [Halobellus limi]SEG37583.1 Predicted nucleotidyltransferase [Halobellus limi]